MVETACAESGTHFVRIGQNAEALPCRVTCPQVRRLTMSCLTTRQGRTRGCCCKAMRRKSRGWIHGPLASRQCCWVLRQRGADTVSLVVVHRPHEWRPKPYLSKVHLIEH